MIYANVHTILGFIEINYISFYLNTFQNAYLICKSMDYIYKMMS